MSGPLQIIGACLSLVPIPGLCVAFSIFQAIWDKIQDIQSLKEQLLQLSAMVAQLLQAVDREHRKSRTLEGSTERELKNLQRLLNDIFAFVEAQSSYGILKVIYRHSDSVLAIEQFYRRISSAVQAFNITALLDLQGWQRVHAEARTQDQETLNVRLNSLEANQNQLAMLLNNQHSTVVAMMVSLQKSLDRRNDDISARERQFLSHSLNYLASTSRDQAIVGVDNWSVTTFEVEFGTVIGSGGFGQVFKGTWNKTTVALKVLRAEEGGIPSSVCIRREIETWLNLRHPHVLQFLGANIFDDRPFILMPYLRNGNARDYVQTNQSCDRVKILHHVALGLMHLHSQGVIHGDLKALNVLIDDAQNAVLCDFGLSRVKADATTRSVHPNATTSVAGSRNWMSPERILGGPLRKTVDVYAFGMTIWELFTGEVPLGHLPYTDFINLVVHQDVRPGRPEEEEAPDLSDELWDLATRCWQKNPNARPNAGLLCDEMEHCMSMDRSSRISSSIAVPAASTSSPTEHNDASASSQTVIDIEPLLIDLETVGFEPPKIPRAPAFSPPSKPVGSPPEALPLPPRKQAHYPNFGTGQRSAQAVGLPTVPLPHPLPLVVPPAPAFLSTPGSGPLLIPPPPPPKIPQAASNSGSQRRGQTNEAPIVPSSAIIHMAPAGQYLQVPKKYEVNALPYPLESQPSLSRNSDERIWYTHTTSTRNTSLPTLHQGQGQVQSRKDEYLYGTDSSSNRRASSPRPRSPASTPLPRKHGNGRVSLADLEAMAKATTWEMNKELKYYLRLADKCARDATECQKCGNLEDAFIFFGRAASLALEIVPAHKDYRVELTSKQRHALTMNGQELLNIKLAEVRALIVEPEATRQQPQSSTTTTRDHAPSSIRELAERATSTMSWDANEPIDAHLQTAQRYRQKGEECIARDDAENGFVELAKAATLVLEMIPMHKAYGSLNLTERHNLSLNGQDIMNKIANIKVQLVDRYDRWESRRNHIWQSRGRYPP